MAEEYIAAIKGRWDDPQIETWAADRFVDEIRRGWRPWFVSMDRDGNVIRTSAEESDYGYRSAAHYEYNIGGRPNSPRHIYANIVADTEERAVKVLNERRTRAIAEGKWPE
jgi:hypothetical protein